MKDTPALDASMPPMIWLQIDTEGDNEADRDEPMPEDALDNVTWCRDSIGGVEVEYVRADLVRAAMPINVTDDGDPELQRLAEVLGMTANTYSTPSFSLTLQPNRVVYGPRRGKIQAKT